MTAPPWGHKPPAVHQPSYFHVIPPPGLSARCLYWLRRADEGNWRPNRHLWKQGYDGRAGWLGVFIWELEKVIAPLLANLEAATSSTCTKALGHDLDNCCQGCHAGWEGDGEYMCDGYDVQARDLHVCCRASIASNSLIHLVPPLVRMRARQ